MREAGEGGGSRKMGGGEGEGGTEGGIRGGGGGVMEEQMGKKGEGQIGVLLVTSLSSEISHYVTLF